MDYLSHETRRDIGFGVLFAFLFSIAAPKVTQLTIEGLLTFEGLIVPTTGFILGFLASRSA